jgi:hypothetical protein
MAQRKLTTDDWNMIVPRIERGQCVPFLGAGANVGADGATGLPLGGEVALRLAAALTKVDVHAYVQEFDKLSKSEAFAGLEDYGELLRLGLQDLPRVSFYAELRQDPFFLLEELRKILSDTALEPTPILRTVARLPLPLIVTTNYDNLMERALDCVLGEGNYERVVQPIEGYDDQGQVDVNAKLDAAAAEGKLVLYKIHGSFAAPTSNGDEGGSSVVVTEEDYIKYLTIGRTEGRGIPNLIASKMKTSTILFLGYSLEDWDFRTFFKGVIEPLERHKKLRSFAFQLKPSDHWSAFWDEKGVRIRELDLTDFAGQLEKKCGTFMRAEPKWDECW